MGIYENYVRSYPDLENKELAKIIEESGEVNAKLKSIKGRIRATKAKLDRDDPTWREQPNEDPPDEEGEDVQAESVQNPGRDGDTYHMDEESREYVFSFTNGRVIRLPFAVMQSVFEWYTKPRALQIRQTVRRLYRKYEIEITENDFRRLKLPLGLTKSSLPFAPHMYKEYSEEVLEARYLEVCESKLETKIRESESKHWYKKFEEEKKKTLSTEMFFERISEELPRLKIPDINPIPRDGSLSPTDILLVLSDWHVGKKVEREFNQYNLDVYYEYLEELRRQIKDHFTANTRPVDNLYICSVGDLVDGVSGDMHPQQDRNQDIHGAKQVLHAGTGLSTIASFCSNLLPDASTRVEYISGNHDRVSKNRKGDPSRVAGEAVFYMARETCDADVEWNLHEQVVGEFRAGNTQVFLTHGDRSPKNFRKVIYARQDKDAKYYLVVSGHLHHLKIMEDLNMLLVQGGSLPGKSDYSVDQLGTGARASQAMLEIRKDGPRPLIWLPLKRKYSE